MFLKYLSVCAGGGRMVSISVTIAVLQLTLILNELVRG